MEGISFIVWTHRPDFIRNVISNYTRQTYPKKEFVIVLNAFQGDKKAYYLEAEKLANTQVAEIGSTIMDCERGDDWFKMCSYDHILTMNDDDYYAPNYANGIMKGFVKSGADIVGKASFFMYVVELKKLLWHGEHRANIPANRIAGQPGRLIGPTISFKKKVLDKVMFFKNRRQMGDSWFQVECGKAGFNFYSVSQYNFVYMRYNQDAHDHQWRMGYERLMRHNRLIADTEDFVPYITRPE